MPLVHFSIPQKGGEMSLTTVTGTLLEIEWHITPRIGRDEGQRNELVKSETVCALTCHEVDIQDKNIQAHIN